MLYLVDMGRYQELYTGDMRTEDICGVIFSRYEEICSVTVGSDRIPQLAGVPTTGMRADSVPSPSVTQIFQTNIS